MVDIYSCTSILYFTRFSVRSSIYELDAVLISDYLRTDGGTKWFLEIAVLHKKFSQTNSVHIFCLVTDSSYSTYGSYIPTTKIVKYL